MDITNKINEIAVNRFGDNNSRFARELETSEANIRNYRSGKEPKLAFIEKLCAKLEISFDDFFGAEKKDSISIADEGKGIPLIPIEAMAGFGTGDIQVMDYSAEVYRVPEFSELNVDFMIRVKGSSMYPKYNSGDLVACKKLLIRDIFFQWNKVYVLDTEQGAIIKRIKPSDKKNYVSLISDNPKYDSFELPMSKINAVALVVGVIRLE